MSVLVKELSAIKTRADYPQRTLAANRFTTLSLPVQGLVLSMCTVI